MCVANFNIWGNAVYFSVSYLYTEGFYLYFQCNEDPAFLNQCAQLNTGFWYTLSNFSAKKCSRNVFLSIKNTFFVTLLFVLQIYRLNKQSNAVIYFFLPLTFLSLSIALNMFPDITSVVGELTYFSTCIQLTSHKIYPEVRTYSTYYYLFNFFFIHQVSLSRILLLQ